LRNIKATAGNAACPLNLGIMLDAAATGVEKVR